MNGLERIAATFARTRAEGRAALMPYFTLGYPDPETSLEILEAVVGAGADLLELGIPFSDPLADGPTVQRSTQAALDQGMTVGRCLELTAQLRQRGAAQPLILMGYYNPILAFGVERFAAESAKAGADGFIVPDLPLEEAGDLKAACQERGLALVFMLAPTATDQRLKSVTAQTSGFLYLVSLTGVTGARQSLPPDLQALIMRAKAAASTPAAVGFGISTPEQARVVGEMADGVIVGSAMINAADGAADPVRAVKDFTASLRGALEPAGHSTLER